ncbi:acyloxyacyl hydrolase [Primorskyibacter sedentarius]|uniref:acyloxyacyl hydrolase n=1 Tax=Primorskyibacter sedentarius TaxID=745311 RepID=UPI003EBA0A7D
MADGTFAVLGLALGLWDMSQNHCPNQGCLAYNQVPSHTAISAGSVYFQDERVDEEIYLRRDTRTAHGPFQLIYGISVTGDGDAWAGLGHAYTMSNASQSAYMQLHAMTGLYLQGDGPDLGGPIEFRSGIEFGLQARSGARFGLAYDHRSNAGIYDSNLGLETIQLRVSIPTN